MVLTGIAIFYFICFGVGFLFALIGAVFGEISGHAEIGAGHDIDLDHGGVEIGEHSLELGHDVDISHDIEPGGHALDVSSDTGDMPSANMLNSITISVFVSFFGLAGLFATYVLKLETLLSLVFAFPLAIIIAAAQFYLYVRVFVQSQASSEATMSDVLGCEAEVITSIPGDRVGEIAYVIKGARYTSAAVSSDGTDLPRGSRVQVVNIRGATLVVRII